MMRARPTVICGAIALFGCGDIVIKPNGPAGGGTPPPNASPPTIATSPCVPGSGKDYQVGNASGQLPTLADVPWEKLAAGDTVRIFHRPEPYVGKFMIAAQGTDAAPVRVCGVKGPNGERPIVDGSGATTRPELAPLYGGKESDRVIHEGRTLILVKHDGSGDHTAIPSHIQIDGLFIRRSHPDYSYTSSEGRTGKYDPFGACIWIERGHGVVIADNEISDCSQGIFARSTDEADFAVTRDIRIAGNAISNYGIAGDDHMHGSYMESLNVTYEYNHYGLRRNGAQGNALKDRGAGTIVRYNRLDDGAHSLDLVECEDFPMTATADPAYRTTFVYGNQIRKNGDLGSFIHYGGDHYGSTPGATWGEPIYRKGTLFFFANTVYATGSQAQIFQLSTTEETAEVWNNVFVFDDGTFIKSMRGKSDIGPGWTSGGVVNLGRNWASSGWRDTDPDHPVPGRLNGGANVLSGSGSPVDLNTFVPLPGSAIVDAAVAGPDAAKAYPVDQELDPALVAKPRPTNGAAPDLGAIEL